MSVGGAGCVTELGQGKLMESIRVAHVGVLLAKPGDFNRQVLYLLTIGILEVGQGRAASPSIRQKSSRTPTFLEARRTSFT